MKKETALLLTLLSSSASGGDGLTDKLIGEWCLNTEEYAGEISVDGSRWTFKADGTYVTKQAYVSEDKYRVG